VQYDGGIGVSSLDNETTLQELKEIVLEFQKKRNWTPYHKPRNLAISICLEAGELLELFQWGDELNDDTHQLLKEELADVVIYCLTMANAMGVDLSESIIRKMEKNAIKYPVIGQVVDGIGGI